MRETLTVTCPDCQKQRTQEFGKLRASQVRAQGLVSSCPPCAGRKGGRGRRKPGKELALRCLCGPYFALIERYEDSVRYECPGCGHSLEHEPE